MLSGTITFQQLTKFRKLKCALWEKCIPEYAYYTATLSEQMMHVHHRWMVTSDRKHVPNKRLEEAKWGLFFLSKCAPVFKLKVSPFALIWPVTMASMTVGNLLHLTQICRKLSSTFFQNSYSVRYFLPTVRPNTESLSTFNVEVINAIILL